jgi:hypothetical protein
MVTYELPYYQAFTLFLRQAAKSGQAAGVGEAIVVVFSDVDVVEKLDAQDFAGLVNAFGKLDVLMAVSWIAGSMWMTDFDCHGPFRARI